MSGHLRGGDQTLALGGRRRCGGAERQDIPRYRHWRSFRVPPLCSSNLLCGPPVASETPLRSLGWSPPSVLLHGQFQPQRHSICSRSVRYPLSPPDRGAEPVRDLCSELTPSRATGTPAAGHVTTHLGPVLRQRPKVWAQQGSLVTPGGLGDVPVSRSPQQFLRCAEQSPDPTDHTGAPTGRCGPGWLGNGHSESSLSWHSYIKSVAWNPREVTGSSPCCSGLGMGQNREDGDPRPQGPRAPRFL